MHGSYHHVWSLPALHAQLVHAHEPTHRATIADELVGLNDGRREADRSMLKHTDEEVLTQRDQPKTTIDTVRAVKTKLTNAEGDIQQNSFKAEEVHDQLDYMEVKILAKERPSNMATLEAADLAVVDAFVCNDSKTDVLRSSNEEGNLSDMSEDSLPKGRGTDATCISGPGAQHGVRVLRG